MDLSPPPAGGDPPRRGEGRDGGGGETTRGVTPPLTERVGMARARSARLWNGRLDIARREKDERRAVRRDALQWRHDESTVQSLDSRFVCLAFGGHTPQAPSLSSPRMQARQARRGEHCPVVPSWREHLAGASTLHGCKRSGTRELGAALYSGMLPCLRAGPLSRLVRHMFSPLISQARVSRGSITASM